MGKFSDLLASDEPIIIAEKPKDKFAQLVKETQPAPFEAEATTGPFISPGEQQQFETERQKLETPKQMFTGELRQTPLTESLPEFTFTKSIENDALADLKMTAGLLTTMTPEGNMKVIKEAIPEARFFKDKKNNVIVDIAGERSVLNQPGMSGQDAVKAIFNIIAFQPASKASALVNSVKAKFGIGVLASAATEQAVQETSKLTGSEEERSPFKTGFAGLIGGLAELPGAAGTIAKRSSAKKQLGTVIEDLPAVAESAAIAKKASEKTGVGLLQAQQTVIPAELERQSFVAQLSAGAEASVKALKKQNVETGNAVEKFMNTIAPPEAIATGAKKFRTAAERAIKVKEAIREELSSPFFNKAKNVMVDVSDVIKHIDDELKPFLGESNIKTQLQRIKSNVARELPENPTTAQIVKAHTSTIEELQKAKAVIDEVLTNTGDTAVKKDAERIVQRIKESLLSAMDGAGSATKEEGLQLRDTVKRLMFKAQNREAIPEAQILALPDYAQGRIRFAQASPDVSDLVDGIVGKVADIKDVDLKAVSKRVFDPLETNPTVIRDAKKAIDNVDKDAWNQLLRVELEKRLGSVDELGETGLTSVENIPAFLYSKLFGTRGNTKPGRILYSALDAEQKKNLKFLQVALDRARRGRPGGSQTAIRKEISKEFDSGVLQAIRNFFTTSGKSLFAAGEEAERNLRIKAASEMLFKTDFVSDMKLIRKLNPKSPEAEKKVTSLLNRILKSKRAQDLSKSAAQQIKETAFQREQIAKNRGGE